MHTQLGNSYLKKIQLFEVLMVEKVIALTMILVLKVFKEGKQFNQT